MDLAGKMHRTFTIDGIPASRIGITVELRFKADFTGRIFCRMTNQPLCRFP